MEQLNNLDVVFLVIVGISVLVSVARGLTKELLSIIGWVLAIVSIYYMQPVVNPIMQKYIASEILSNLVSGMAILIIFCILWILFVDKITMQIRFSHLSSLDRILGVLFGGVRGVLIVILMQIMISSLIPAEAEKGIFAESKYFKLAGEYSDPVKAVIPEKWLSELKDKSESFVVEDKGKAKTENKNDKSEADKEAQKDKNSNDDIMKKSGNELFDTLVQPKTNAEVKEETVGYTENMEKDLDYLMDILDDNIVSSENESSVDSVVEVIETNDATADETAKN